MIVPYEPKPVGKREIGFLDGKVTIEFTDDYDMTEDDLLGAETEEGRMSLKVYDFHTDIANVLVTPQIRCRFMKMEVGQAAAGHTHDLGTRNLPDPAGAGRVRGRR